MAEAFAQAIKRQESIRDRSAWVWRTSFLLASRELGERSGGGPPGREGTYEMTIPP